jgi:hypothetical protein
MSSSDVKKPKKSKKPKNKPDDSENQEYYDDNIDDGGDPNNSAEDLLDDQEVLMPKVVPSGQRGFNGQLTIGNVENSVYVSNTPKIRLEDNQPITHDLIKRFVAQIRRGDFKGTIESLIDKLVWEQILLIAQSKCFEHDNPEHVAQLKHLDNLAIYVSKGDNVEFDLTQTIWNQDTILQLLLDSYPKGTQSNDLDSFVNAARQIPPQYDYTNAAIEQAFCSKNTSSDERSRGGEDY